MNKQKIINIILVAIAGIALLFGGYFYYKVEMLQKNAAPEATKEKDDLLAKVSMLYLIPQDDDVTIATVADPKALEGQAFFSRSNVGDKVLIFTKAGTAILYRPSIGKIIEIAPIANKPSAVSTDTPVVVPASHVQKKK